MLVPRQLPAYNQGLRFGGFPINMNDPINMGIPKELRKIYGYFFKMSMDNSNPFNPFPFETCSSSKTSQLRTMAFG